MSDVRPRYSCVMATGPRYAQQTLTLVWTLLDLAGIAADRIVVHAIEGAEVRARRQLEALGIEVRVCQPFREGFPHCNKLRQLEDQRLLAGEATVLCDTDLAFVADVRDGLPVDGVRAKVVDLPNPPVEMWHGVLSAAGLSLPTSFTHTSFGEHTTPRFNCNGGLYLIHGNAASVLAEAWPRWANWLIERPALLPGGFAVHTDQVAFGLAVWERGVALDLLPLAWNYPTHSAVEPKPDLEPRVLHYHDHVDPSGFLQPVGRPTVDQAIGSVNRVIAARRREHFDNATFWNFRYDQAPELGSGLGSRGESLTYKRDQLRQLVPAGGSVLDVGCGDLEVSRELETSRYTGVDVSAEALAIAQTKRPEWTFREGQVRDLDLRRHDTVLSFDVLIHQRTRAAYRSLVADLVRLAGQRLIIGAYDAPPSLTSEITFYHEPITTTLGRLVGPRAVRVVGGYRDAAIVAVDMSAADGELVERLGRTVIFETIHGRVAAVEDDLIAGHFRDFGGHTRNELAMVLSLVRPGDTVIDVGAHIGSFAVPIARRVGPTGRVIAIEPDSFNVEMLYRNIALGDVDDRVEVVEGVVVGPGGAMRAEPTAGNTGAWHFVADPGGSFSSRTLDDIVASANVAEPALVKIDVEGMEVLALQSATRTIERAKPIIYCEVSDAQLARYGVSAGDLDGVLRRHGYVFFRNSGPRNSAEDSFTITALESVQDGGAFFDCLAVTPGMAERLRRSAGTSVGAGR